MRLFMDTANIDEIRRGAALGVVDGVTTNPSLVAKSGKKIVDVIREICSIVPGPVSAEVAHRVAAAYAACAFTVYPSIAEGFALRIVPDRGIDEGWTVRATLPAQPALRLEIDTYTDISEAAKK